VLALQRRDLRVHAANPLADPAHLLALGLVLRHEAVALGQHLVARRRQVLRVAHATVTPIWFVSVMFSVASVTDCAPKST
jgi:hypothetical protein